MTIWQRFWAKVDTVRHGSFVCFDWTGATRNGYGALQVGTHARPRAGYTHRLVWEQAHGPIPAGMDIAHVCHNRRCVRLKHLRLTTRAENMAQSVAAGWPNGNRSLRTGS